MPNVLLTFDGLGAGEFVDDQFVGQGVSISSANPDTPPMVFDTENPTGGDHDLATSNLGNVLILSEDGDSSDPDDNAGGGTFVFEFSEPSQVINFNVLDIEEGGGCVNLYDSDGALLGTVHIPVTGNNGQGTVWLTDPATSEGFEDVARMEVTLQGSGAIDNFCYCPPDPGPDGSGDGVVDGTNAAEIIDAGYLADPEGDRIDNNDALLPGEVGDDDIVDALGGDDTVIAGAGNDEVYAGSGDDSVRGNSGDDILYGDSNYTGDSVGSASRESLNWSLETADDDDENSPLGNFTQSTGSVDVSFTIVSEAGSAVTEFEPDTQLTDGIASGDETVNDSSSLYSLTNGDAGAATYALEFSQEVENISFRINDVDGDGFVRVQAFDGDGNPVDITLEGGSRVLTNDANGTIDSEGGYAPDTSLAYSTLVTIGGPIARLEIQHDQTGPNNSGINITDIFFDVPVVDDGLAGNDTLVGGSGNDILYGEDGDDVLRGGRDNDTLVGGEGADTILGGNDRDVILGGTDGDVIDGGTGGDDFDVLDLAGVGPARIVNQTIDADGDSTSGTIELLDGLDGNVIGTLTFSEIEKIENVVPCFTPGTSIATPRGEVLVEDLQVGDRVITRDSGIQEIRWIGAKRMDGRVLSQSPHLQPILVKQGSLGHGLPERDMLVSPNHRMLVNNDRVPLYFDDNEVLVAAKHLVNPSQGVQSIASVGVTYIHFMFDNHEVVLSNGAWTESFQPGDYSLKGLGNAQRNEIFELFPELQGERGREAYASARLTLKKHEARMLFK